MLSPHLSWLLLLLLSMITLPISKASFIIQVPPRDEECFSIHVHATSGSTLFGNYDQLNDDVTADPLTILVLDRQNDRILHRSRRASKEGTFKVSLKPSQHVQLCIQNGILNVRGRSKTGRVSRHNDDAVRRVGLQFQVVPRDENEELQQQNDKNIRQATNLQQQLDTLKNHHEYMRMREAIHRSTVEETFTQVLVWALLRGVMVVVVAVVQIAYLRRFVEVRRYI